MGRIMIYNNMPNLFLNLENATNIIYIYSIHLVEGLIFKLCHIKIQFFNKDIEFYTSEL